MAKKRTFSKQHLANLRAAHAKRREAAAISMRSITDYVPVSDENSKGLIDRMTQAIDKIKEQIERLETL